MPLDSPQTRKANSISMSGTLGPTLRRRTRKVDQSRRPGAWAEGIAVLFGLAVLVSGLAGGYVTAQALFSRAGAHSTQP